MTAVSRGTQHTLATLAAAVEGRGRGGLTAQVLGDEAIEIDAVAPLESAHRRELGFLANARYRNAARASSAGAIVMSAADADALKWPAGTTSVLVLCAQPYAWFAFAAQELQPAASFVPGVHPRAEIDPLAVLAQGVRIEAGAVIAAGAQIGAACWIGAGAVIGTNSRIGAGSRLFAGATVLDGCQLGERCIVHAGAVIGADGFGFAPFDGGWVKIPQSGAVTIGNDVEIGANTTIDRGTMGDTVIEDGVKIDNQVQVGHNCRIGASTVVAGCTGIAGSAIIGRRCQLGGASMIHGHISICDDTIVSGGTLISRSIATPGFYSGVFPFMPNREWERNAALLRHLQELRGRIRALESGRGSKDDAKDDA